jgi:hypothetical protein
VIIPVINPLPGNGELVLMICEVGRLAIALQLIVKKPDIKKCVIKSNHPIQNPTLLVMESRRQLCHISATKAMTANSILPSFYNPSSFSTIDLCSFAVGQEMFLRKSNKIKNNVGFEVLRAVTIKSSASCDQMTLPHAGFLLTLRCRM